MTKIYTAIILMVIALLPQAAHSAELDERADSAYMEGKYDEAAQLYE